MTTFAFFSLVSPGVTTSVLALAHVWPAARPVVVVDCAPAGGTIGQRLGLDVDGGLASVAATLRTEPPSAQLVLQNAVRAGRVDVLVAPTSGRSTRAALDRIGAEMADVLRGLPGDALVDCGRAWPGSPAMPIVRGADRTILVTRATRHELERVSADAAGAVGDEDTDVELLLIGEPTLRSPRSHTADMQNYPASEVSDRLGLPVAGVIGEDRRGAARLGFGAPWLDRSYLVSTARRCAADMLAANGATPVPPQPVAGE